MTGVPEPYRQVEQMAKTQGGAADVPSLSDLIWNAARQGRLVLPVGGSGYQNLELWTQENGVWQPQEILPVAFVPLRGQHGWK